MNGPSSAPSPAGRRIIVAVVTGESGERIQRWRARQDPDQAKRLPPHTTLCYWTPDVDLDCLERQVRHAFARPVEVTLGEVREFENDQHTFYVEVLEAGALDEARRRLYDRTHVALPGYREWTWHVTCVRESKGRNLDALRAAASELRIYSRWKVDTVACLELRRHRYEPLARWRVGP